MAPPAAPGQIEVDRPARPARWLAGACALAVAASVLAVAAALASGEEGGRLVTASPVPEGVHPVLLGGVAYVVHRDGGHAVAFPGGDASRDMLQWCPGPRVLTGINRGSVFNADGQIEGGPAGYGLTRIPATVEPDGRIALHPERAEPGLDRRGEPDPDPWYPRIGTGWLDRFTTPSYCPAGTDT
jgi:hypothetical protein